MAKKERILLKLSGASLKGSGDHSVINDGVIDHLTDQIKAMADGREIAIVVGGGNIWRGDENVPPPLKNQDTHIMGMLATIMNAIALQNYLSHKGVSSTIFSAVPIARVAEEICTQSLRSAFKRGEVVIFAGGTGVPFVTTDTCAAIRALEINADKVLIGKNGVNGVYDKDPNQYADANFYERISYEEIIDRRLAVMDLAAMSLLLRHGRPELIVFNNDEEDSFVRALTGNLPHTVIY